MVATKEITDTEKVVKFKMDWLTSAGYNKRNARRIAEDDTINWHTAYDIRKNCNDEELCMRVLFGSHVTRTIYE